MEKKILSFKVTADSWQMKIQEKMKIPFPFAWLLLSFILFSIGYCIIFFFDKKASIGLVAAQSVLIAAIANSVIFYEMLLDEVADIFPDILDEQKERTYEWICQSYLNIFWSKKNLLAGLFLGILNISINLESITKLYETLIGRVYGGSIYFIIGLTSGSMFWIMLGIGKMMSSLGKDTKIKLSVFDTDTSALRAASSLLWKVSLVASLVYALGISLVFFYKMELTLMCKIMVVCFGFFVLLYFIIPQLNIHKTLVHIKRLRLKKLVQQIDIYFDKVTENPSPEHINQLKELFQLQCVVNKQNSWSFGTEELLTLAGTVVIPLILFLGEYIIKIIFKQ